MFMEHRSHIKNRLFTCLVIILICFSFLISGISVFADDREYTISEYEINAIINSDGSADIEEILTYDFDGDFNGVFRDIDFSETDGVVNPRVFVVINGSLSEISLNSTSDLDADGQSRTYNMVNSGNLTRFKIFEKSSNERKTFVIRYTFHNAVTKYNDVAEFNRKIVDSNWDVMLNNITINISIPKGANKEDIRVFGHGSLLGESKIIDGENVVFSVPYVFRGDMVETLVLFPTELVPDAKRIVDEEALPRILANEKALAEEANEEREAAKREAERQMERERILNAVGKIIAAILFVLWFPLIFYIYIKYDKELKSSFTHKYYRELPGEYTPAEMSFLLSMGNVQSRDITATLMDLVRKRFLLLSTEKSLKKGLFGSKEIEEYIVSLNPRTPNEPLKEHESFLIDWFIKKIGNGNSVILSSISKYTKTESNARQFKKDYDAWCKTSIDEAKKLGFIDESSKKGVTVGVLLSLAYLALGLLIIFLFGSFWGVALVLQFFIMLIFSARISRRTPYGNEQKAMWEAFKNFLKDFSQMDKAVLPSIIIWEHYLVYAISLGIAKEVIEQLPMVISETELNNGNLTYMRSYGGYGGFVVFSNTLNRTVDSINGSINNAMSVANSTLSSSSGGGGGFSGGSSGGGGGGGGGGAF